MSVYSRFVCTVFQICSFIDYNIQHLYLPFLLETIYSMLINKDEKLQEYKYRTDPHNNNYSLPL